MLMATPQAFKIIAFMIGFVLFFFVWPIGKMTGRLFIRILILPIDFLAWLVERGFFLPNAMRIEKELQVIKMKDEMKLLDKIIADPGKLINSEYGDMSPQEYARLVNDQEFKQKERLLRQEKRKGVIHAVYK